MRFRKLRIAWSVAWGILCLLLIAMWVRSYRYHEYVTGTVRQQAILNSDGLRAAGESVFLVSAHGVLSYVQASGAVTTTTFEPWHYGKYSSIAKQETWTFTYGWPETSINVPHWFPP